MISINFCEGMMIEVHVNSILILANNLFDFVTPLAFFLLLSISFITLTNLRLNHS